MWSPRKSALPVVLGLSFAAVGTAFGCSSSDETGASTTSTAASTTTSAATTSAGSGGSSSTSASTGAGGGTSSSGSGGSGGAGGGAPGVTCPAPVAPTRQMKAAVHAFFSGGGLDYTADATSYDDVFGRNKDGTTSPFPHGSNITLTLLGYPDQYVALAIQVPADLASDYSGTWGFHATGATAGVPISMSLSKCPGDFSDGLPPACKGQWAGSENAGVVVGAPEIDDPYGTVCKVERGQTYYLNLVFASLATPNVTGCPDASCTMGLDYL